MTRAIHLFSKLVSCTILLAILLQATSLSAQVYTYKKFDHKDGLNLTGLLSIDEDDKGFIWIGTDGAGLTRFDGQEFVSFGGKYPEVGVNEHIKYIQAFNSDSIMYASEFSGINIQLKDTAVKFALGNDSEFRKLGIFPIDNVLCLLTSRGIFLQKDSTIISQFIFNKASDVDVYSVCPIASGKLLFTSIGTFVITAKKIEFLHEWLSTSPDVSLNFIHAINYGDSIKLFDRYLENEMIVLMDKERPKFFITSSLPLIKINNTVKKRRYLFSDHRDGVSVFVGEDGSMQKYDGENFSIITANTGVTISSPSDIIIDRNGDFWVTSKNDGLFRVSLEPFTNIEINDIYKNPYISFAHLTNEDYVLLSTFKNKTQVRKIYSEIPVKEFDFRIKGIINLDVGQLVATTEGLKKFKNGSFEDVPNSKIDGVSPSLIFKTKERFFVCFHEKGIYEFNPFNEKLSKLDLSGVNLKDQYYYTSQIKADSTGFLIGTNVGIYIFNIENNNVEMLSANYSTIGGFIGTSVIDSYGIRWFTADKGLIAYLPDNTIKTITDLKFFPSTLFYTLNADNYGNLYIGTNAGINVLEVNERGDAISNKVYNISNGFAGYETHMNSQFQSDFDNLYVGTVEGLYLIKPSFLQNRRTAYRPILIEVKNKISKNSIDLIQKGSFDESENNLYFKFKTINPGSNYIRYSYRLITSTDSTWSEWTDKNEVFFNNLSKGNYKFEVKSSLDDLNSSEITSYEFTISQPFYKTKWFLLSGILLLVILNVFILDRNKRFNQSNIIVTKDIGLSYKMSNTLLLFGAITNTTTHLAAPYIDTSVPKSLVSTIVVGLFIFGLFIYQKLSVSRKPSLRLLKVGMIVLLIHNFALIYASNIHAFFVVAVVIYGMVLPIIFNTLRQIIALSVVQLILSIIIVLNCTSSVYNEIYFIIAVSLSGCITILLTYLRNESLEKLIFTSGVVNKGNNLVVAFNESGNIIYLSENHESVLDIDTHEYIGLPISALNKFQPVTIDDFTNEDLAKDFLHGKVFSTPMQTLNGEIAWYQWSCNEFSEDVKVIIGQDITEKINLESYYELIVQNADDFIYQCDLHGNIYFANEKTIELIGESTEDVYQTNFQDILAPKGKAKIAQFYIDQFNENIKNTYLEFAIINKYGEERWIGQNVTVIYKTGSKKYIKGFLAIGRDITDRRLADKVIKEQNDDITASINYARRIQFNLLPQKKYFNQFFEESFIYYKPKDIVSGDFFWVQEVDNKIIVICSDCTGHGVPGAFMTLLGFNLLNQIVAKNQVTDPGEILNNLNDALIEVLPRDGKDKINDGMETSVVVFEKDSKEVKYSLAGAKFTIITKEGLQIIKGNNKHIGDENDLYGEFETSSLILERDDAIYLYSDGYFDQFGGERGKKLSSKRFNALLTEIKDQALRTQREKVKDFLMNWKDGTPQTDDITVIGLKNPWNIED